MRAPRYIDCPACGAMRVTRLHQRCRVCRVLLAYHSEYLFRAANEPAWVWTSGQWVEWLPGQPPPFACDGGPSE